MCATFVFIMCISKMCLSRMYRHNFLNSCFSHDKSRTKQTFVLLMIHEKKNFHLKNFQDKNIHSNCYKKKIPKTVYPSMDVCRLPFGVYCALELSHCQCMRACVLVYWLRCFFGYAMSFVHYFAWFSCDKNDMSCEW